MKQSVSQINLGFHPEIPIQVTFDAPQISSDGGLLLLREIDEETGISERFASSIPDGREEEKVKFLIYAEWSKAIYRRFINLDTALKCLTPHHS
jgi:hypothetical protein